MSSGPPSLRSRLSNKPLTVDQIEDLFVETSSARDPEDSRRQEIADALEIEPHAKVLVTGHRGCGKSTELVKLETELADRYVVARVWPKTEGKLVDLKVEELLVLVVEQVLRRIDQLPHAKGELDDRVLQEVYAWFDEVIVKSETRRDATATAAAGVDTKGSLLDKLVGLFARASFELKTGTRSLESRVRQQSGGIHELVQRCNTVFNEANDALVKTGQELLVIVEDIDKAEIDEARRLFIDNPGVLTTLTCKAIFTAPMFLMFMPTATVLSASFALVTIPLIKVTERDGQPSTEGRAAIRAILQQRLPEGLVQEDALDLAIAKTGGMLRHLFDVLVYAERSAFTAARKDGSEAVIRAPNVRYGLDRQLKNLSQRVSTIGLPQDFGDVTVAALQERLKELVGVTAPISNDRVNLVLLTAQLLLEYNGAGWHRLHPLAEEYADVLRAGDSG